MGCYDTIIGKCPECNAENYFQSKSGDCCLETYDIEEAPNEIMQDANRHTPEQCEGCEKLLFVDIENRKLRLATDSEITAKKERETKAREGIKKFNEYLAKKRRNEVDS